MALPRGRSGGKYDSCSFDDSPGLGFGLVFFRFSLVTTIRLLCELMSRSTPDRYNAIVCFFGVWNVWALVIAPFAGFQRVYVATAFLWLFVA
jgi:hypothetical protein